METWHSYEIITLRREEELVSIVTNLKGRLRNTNLSQSRAMFPLFEAVVNSIHAIEDAGLPPAEGRIDIEVLRRDDNQLSLSSEMKSSQNDIVTFRVTDNGIGFSDINMLSFKELDSLHKRDRGGRGMGRLLWLKAFKQVFVKSIFQENGILRSRSFFFDENGISRETLSDVVEKTTCRTMISLEGLFESFQKKTPKKLVTLAEEIFEHCLGYYIRPEGAPNIKIFDQDESIFLNEIYDQNLSTSISADSVEVKWQVFDIAHVRLRRTALPPKVHYCVAQRSVQALDLKKMITGLFGKLEDEEGVFYYVCYVTSPFLNERAHSERAGFDIAEEQSGLFHDVEISFKEIDAAIVEKVEMYLNPYLETSREESFERISRLVDNELPSYRPILKNMDKKNICFPPSASKHEMELQLYKEKSKLDAELLEKGQRILEAKNESVEDYNQRMNEYLQLAGDLKQAELARYVVHRRVVLDFLKKLIERMDNGGYSQERAIHSLIMPMGKDSEEINPYENNLWLIDEKLVFHHYLSSDKSIKSMPITGSNSEKEPDLLKLDLFDKPTLVGNIQQLPLASITIVEFKRPMRNDMKEGEVHDPIEQALKYLRRVREGKVLTLKGRPIPRSENTPGFCYVICDLTPTMIERCEVGSLAPTSDQMGFFGFNKNFNAYIEVISYEKLLSDAMQRNQAFFEKLSLSSVR